ncbi:glycerol-3-phosphate dehydrogenase [Burkholderiaceae bacterium UC74_6]
MAAQPIREEEDPAAQDVLDVIVVGGGINGCGIARDLAGRGLAVLLAERDDLAAHTSSCSTKLIHGGLRYLEHREFALVRKSLQEREVLLRSAPHLMGAQRFIMPWHAGVGRPAWMVRMGLFLYDHLARREWLPGSTGLNLVGTELGLPLQTRFERGFSYYDGWADDARLVIACALDAHERGAQVLTRSPVTSARRLNGLWHVELQTPQGPRRCQARVLVNAAGPWAASFLREGLRMRPHHDLRLVRGSHIVVPARFTHDAAYLFQNEDGRIIFAIPYREHFTLIGTTDVEVDEPGAARISEQEIDYLCAQASRYFRAPVRPDEVRWTYAGVRPLLDDVHTGSAQTASRDYLLELDDDQAAPLMTVWGGKLTTFRKLAEEASDRLVQRLRRAAPAWTARATLPGGDLADWIVPSGRPDADFERFLSALTSRHAALPPALLRRLARAYGGRVERVLAHLGAEVAPGVFEGELHHLVQSEWAQTLDDVLWRRSKLGLVLDPAQQQAVAHWLSSR